MRSSRRRPYRPAVLPLEERLPLGDGVLGLLVGAALLPGAAPAAAVAPSAGERGVSTPRLRADTGGFTPPARPDEASPFAEAYDAATPGDTLTAAFAPSIRRQGHAFLPSPQREQGVDSSPSLTLRAGEARDHSHPFTAPLVAVAPAHTDATLLVTLVGMRPTAIPKTETVTPTRQAQVKESFGRLPLSFEQNVGQTDAQVHFFTRGPGYGLYLTATEAVMVLQQPTTQLQDCDFLRREGEAPAEPCPPGSAGASPSRETAPPAVVRMQVVGGNPSPRVEGRDEQPGKVNYFRGNNPSKWRTSVSTFAKVEYDEVYPGIDLVYYGNNQQLEYDFVVAPGADPNAIRLHVSGAERMEIDAAGDLLVHVGEPGGVSPGSTLRQHKPFVYQEGGGRRQEVASRFVLDEQQVRFDVAAYDAARPLVIDPVLSYSTYLGGSGADAGAGVAVDPATGDAFLTGAAYSHDFPTVNPFQSVNRGGYDVFVTRLRADGQALVYSTYLGGSGARLEEFGESIALLANTGDAYVTGITDSTDFPTVNPFQPKNGGGVGGFVARLSADGATLVYSTYLGGSSWEIGITIAADPGTGDAFVVGQTMSLDFPTANPFQPNYGGGFVDGFVTRLAADGSSLIYSTYLGGSDGDTSTGVAVDPATGHALLTGWTSSDNFPTVNPYQPTNRGFVDAFVARLAADGRSLIYSTYLGGTFGEWGQNLAVDPVTGDVFVTGEVDSNNFPTVNPFQPTRAGLDDVFLTRLAADGRSLVYSTYLGGTGLDRGTAVAVDPDTGTAFVTGLTWSGDFPTANALQTTYGGGSLDAFITRFAADGRSLVYSTYLGGTGLDMGQDVAVDRRSGAAVVTGGTISANFPTANPFQASHAGDGDAFVTRIGSSPVAYYYIYPDGGAVTAGVPFDFYMFALDAQFNVIPDYAGLVLFWATDPQATTPVYYQFQRTDRGVASFPGGLTFNTVGFQELYVFDWPGVQAFGYAAFQVG